MLLLLLAEAINLGPRWLEALMLGVEPTTILLLLLQLLTARVLLAFNIVEVESNH